MLRLLSLLLVIFLFSCTPKKPDLAGVWRGVVEVQGQELPFTFDLEQQGAAFRAVLHNASERLVLDEVSIEKDTLVMILHIFDAQIRAKIDDGKLTGVFIKNYALSETIPFHATKGDSYRFTQNTSTSLDFSGTYAVTFTNEKDTTLAVGYFEQNGNDVTGTFLTPTGDYRYLQGNVVDDELRLSTFDGNHTYLFTARQNGDTLTGDYFSGKKYRQQWIGVKKDSASLPNPESLTFLKEGYDKIEFNFPDVNGKKISPQDPKYVGKVLIIQLFGTWCPNCMDETRFLTEWYNQNASRGIEIIGLAYERKDDFAYASDRVKKMQAKLNVPYDFVIAGVNDKLKAAETLPMLNKVVAFPTTIFIGKDGKVKHIHTGFSGPGTGIYYEQFKERFNEIINECLAESM